MGEDRAGMLAEIRESNEERKSSLLEKGFMPAGLETTYVVTLLETLLGGVGSPLHIEACISYEERRAEALDFLEVQADEVIAARVAAQAAAEKAATDNAEAMAHQEAQRRLGIVR